MFGDVSAAAAVDVTCGTIAGASQIIVGFPFDTVKVNQQLGNSSPAGPLSVARSIVASQGVRGLYRGISPPMATVAAFNALLFGTTGYLNRLIRPDGGPPTPAEAALTGAASGVPVALLATPTELLKCRMQRQGGARPRPGAVYTAADAAAGRILYRGAMDAARQIVMFEGGVAALFRGLVPTLFREIPGNAAYFGIYVLAKEKLAAWQGLGSAAELGPGSLMAAGGLAGAAFWAPTIPIDVIKTRIQTDNPLDPGRPRGVAGTAQALLRAEGWAGFVRGWQPCMARSVPANATTFLAYELAHTALSRAAGLGEH